MNEITKALLDGKAVVVEMEWDGETIEFRGYMKNGSLHGCYRFNLPEPMYIMNRFVKPDGLDEYFQEMAAIYKKAVLVETFEPLVRQPCPMCEGKGYLITKVRIRRVVCERCKGQGCI